MTEREKEFSFDFIDIIRVILRWKWHLIIVSVLAGVAAAVFTGPSFMTPKFKAVAVFYPTSNNSVSNAILTDNRQRQKDPLEFGEEEQAEQALQVLKSSALTSRLINNYNLMEHYEIEKDNAYPMSSLNDKIKDNISYNRTQYMSIEISVLDEDPQMAADMANGIMELYDTVKTEIQRQVADKALTIVRQQYESKVEEVNSLRNQLRELGAKGVINPEEQSKGLAEQYYKAKATGNQSLIHSFQEQLDTLAKYAPAVTTLNETLILELDKLSELRAKYERAQVDVNETLSNKFVMSAAGVPEKKAWPRRTFITLAVTVSTFLFALVVLGLINLYRAATPSPTRISEN